MKLKRGRLALIDADIVVYAGAAALEKHIDFGDGDVIISPGEADDACGIVFDEIRRLAQDVGAVETVVAMSCNRNDNWRRDLLPSYKGNRSDTNDPVHREAVKAFVRKHFDAFERPRMEADDLLGVMATRPNWHDWPLDRRVIVSEDKDFLQVPCTVFNPRHKTEKRIDFGEGEYWHLMQTMMGDSTDGYKGIPRVGIKTAHRLLFDNAPVDWHEAWPAMVALAETKGMTEADLLVQARVARILRHGEYDKGKPIYWEPRR